jgi:hypothetical protein
MEDVNASRYVRANAINRKIKYAGAFPGELRAAIAAFGRQRERFLA